MLASKMIMSWAMPMTASASQRRSDVVPMVLSPSLAKSAMATYAGP
jgi:hypothetical protein